MPCRAAPPSGTIHPVDSLAVHIVGDRRDPAAVDRLLRALPNWFGIAESVTEYVTAAGRLPTYLAYPDGGNEPVGALLLARHFPEAAEVYLMAVAPDLHRRGVGRALLQAAEEDLSRDGAQFLQVKTLGPSRPDGGYQKTRSFYLSQGFAPLEEIHELWPGNPCLILIKALVSGARRHLVEEVLQHSEVLVDVGRGVGETGVRP
jgi:GNAT superfamily N-acetyltransferase